MLRTLIAGSLAAAALSATPLLSSAAQTASNAREMAALQYLVGTWHCDWQSGNATGSEDQIVAPALDGAWLEEREVVEARGRQTVASIHYTRYDPRKNAYIHMGPDANGSYEIAQSADGDVWHAADGEFVHHKVSDTQRTMSETERVGNATVHISMTCVKTK